MRGWTAESQRIESQQTSPANHDGLVWDITLAAHNDRELANARDAWTSRLIAAGDWEGLSLDETGFEAARDAAMADAERCERPAREETTMQTEITITTRTRNLGYGWSTGFRPVEPDDIGTVKTVRRAMVERRRILGSDVYYTDRLFVGGVPLSDESHRGNVGDILNEVECDGYAVVTLNPALRAGEIGALLGVSRQSVLVWYEADKLPGAWRQGRGREVRMYRDDVLKLRTASGHV